MKRHEQTKTNCIEVIDIEQIKDGNLGDASLLRFGVYFYERIPPLLSTYRKLFKRTKVINNLIEKDTDLREKEMENEAGFSEVNITRTENKNSDTAKTIYYMIDDNEHDNK